MEIILVEVLWLQKVVFIFTYLLKFVTYIKLNRDTYVYSFILLICWFDAFL